MAQKNDQVFQLSLTEIAFIVAFLLLLLLGYLVSKEQSEREAAEAALANLQSIERTTEALNDAKAELSSLLRGAGAADPDELISKLVADEELRAERDLLRKQVADLDAKLTALTELKSQLASIPEATRADAMRDEVASALALQREVRAMVAQAPSEGAKEPTKRTPGSTELLDSVRQALTTTSELKRQLKESLGKQLPRGQEGQTIQAVLEAAKHYQDSSKSGKSPAAIQRENSDLRGQVAFLKNRLDARGGRDYPPCWADENGKVEFLFAIELLPDAVVVNPAWPARREAAARALPGMDVLLAGPHSTQKFISAVQGVFNWSKAQDPECRHYVQLKSSISDAVQSDRARLMVEGFFYKVEVRR